MINGYNPDLGEFDCTQIDVLLAEYVDGSMDPVVRSAFEEWMRSDPAVADRVMSLQGVRRELCRLGCRCAAPAGFEERLRSRLALEEMRDSMSGVRDVTAPLRVAAALATLVVALLAGGVALTQGGLMEEEGVQTASSDLIGDDPRDRPPIRRGVGMGDGMMRVGVSLMHSGFSPASTSNPYGTYQARFPAWGSVTLLDSASHRMIAAEAVSFP